MIFTFSVSGHVTKSDKEEDEMAERLANLNLQSEERKQQLEECNIASPSKSTNTIEQLFQRKLGAQGRRSSLPPNSTKKEQLNGALFHSRSESHLSQNRKLQLSKLLMTNVGNGAFLNFWCYFRTYFVLYPRLNSSIQSSSIE